MSGNRQLILGALGLTVIVSLIAVFFIWPGYREATSVRREVMKLKSKIADLGNENEQVQKLHDDVDRIRRRVSTQLKAIPESPDVAGLMSKLSLPMDGVSVTDQTFTAGTPEDLHVGNKRPIKSMPLKVEMDATFDSIFALIRAAESMQRLMRVSAVKVICKRDESKGDGAPILNASISLDAIYDPPQVTKSDSEGD